jgi:hypothetical protein
MDPVRMMGSEVRGWTYDAHMEAFSQGEMEASSKTHCLFEGQERSAQVHADRDVIGALTIPKPLSRDRSVESKD